MPDGVNPPSPARRVPTLDDVERLTPESDYAAFTAPHVDEHVRNEALKKLFFGDPHFNTGDGLDVRAEADCESERSPRARQCQILRARALGLLDDALVDQDPPEPGLPPGGPVLGDTAPANENTDLRLQPDDAAGPPGAGPGTAPGAGRGG